MIFGMFKLNFFVEKIITKVTVKQLEVSNLTKALKKGEDLFCISNNGAIL